MTPGDNPIFVTRPLIPPLAEYITHLEQIWERKWLTNDGDELKRLEIALKGYLKVRGNLKLFNNGTTAWLIGLKALGIEGGEVVVTPFTFPATVHALPWLGVTPVFADINDETLNIDPAAIESLLTNKTKAILGVHVYGHPCDVIKINSLAQENSLKVAYDGAHAFGVEIDGRPISDYGDITMLSFHATKMFNTAEGGALIYADPELNERIRLLHNFGIANEDQVLLPGLNGKMNELQAAFGLAVLPYLERERIRRSRITMMYREQLGSIEGLRVIRHPNNVRPSLQYFVVRINAEVFGTSRDMVWSALRAKNIFARKYFAPLCSEYPSYAALPSASPHRLPVANRVAREVLALPLHGDLSDSDVERTVKVILEARHT